jgi:molybdopterin-guanine dinucleotide biosynthesis protein A
LEQQFAAGERAIHRAVTGLAVKYLQIDTEDLRNVNTQEDLLE